MKKIEVVAVVLAGLIVSYMIGYHDGVFTKHRTIYNEVVNATPVSR